MGSILLPRPLTPEVKIIVIQSLSDTEKTKYLQILIAQIPVDLQYKGKTRGTEKWTVLNAHLPNQ